MDGKKKISIGLLAVGVLLIVAGIVRMYAPGLLGQMVLREDTVGVTILSIGAVMSIFATGSMVGEQSQSE